MYTRVPREVCYRRLGRHPSRQKGWRLTRDNQGSPRAREVGREGTQDAREARVVRFDAATGKRGGWVVTLVDVRRAYFHAPARRRVFVELPPEDFQGGDGHMCGLLQYRLYGVRDAAQDWEEELASTLSDVTIEAEQRHVREILKHFELERAGLSATPCAVARKNEGNARSGESKGPNRCGRGQTQINREWDDMYDSDDRDRPQMADDVANECQAPIGDITRYRAFVARISNLPQDRPDLKFASMQVSCVMAKPSVRDMEGVKRIGRYLAGKPRAKCWIR